jgi:Pentapeptide repeats (8 copies)
MADLILREDLLERVKRAPRPEVRELLEELDRQQEVVQKKLNRLLGEPPEQFLQREPQEVRKRLRALEQGEPQQVQELVQLSAQLKERRDEELQRLMIEMEEPMMMATAFTRTTLGRVDGSRKGKIIDFLHETNMINRAMTVVVLQRADISHADVSNLNLAGDDLSGANLSHANLTGADLTGADLTGANLRAADLTRTQLGTARLTLVHGDEETEPAPPNPAVLNRANLSYADLSYARGWTYEQLDRAESLDDATMPDGRSYAYWVEKGWLRTRSDRDARGRGRESSST